MVNPFKEEINIFNGAFKLTTEDQEFRMSLWVKGFGLGDQMGNELLPFLSAFDLMQFEETTQTLNIKFKIFPNGAKIYEAEINPFNQTFNYQGQELPLKEFKNTFKNNDSEY